MAKDVKQIVQNVHTGQIAVEYSDDSYRQYNLNDLVTQGELTLALDDLVTQGELTLAKQNLVTQEELTLAKQILTISGDYTVGETLTANFADGWSGSLQWTRDGVNIDGETAATYVLDLADEDTLVSCVVSNPSFTATGSTVAAAA